jgi:hypothetical protein
VALQIGSFEENYPPTCSNLVHPNCERGAGLTELDKVLCYLLCYVWGSKVFILVLCRLSVLTVYEVRRQRGWAVFVGKPFITELMSALLLALLRWNWEGLLFTSAVGHSTLIMKVNRLWVGIVRPAVSE